MEEEVETVQVKMTTCFVWENLDNIHYSNITGGYNFWLAQLGIVQE